MKLNQHQSAKIRINPVRNIISNGVNQRFNKINKPLLAAAVSDIIPQDIYTRSKIGFTFPFQKWLKEGLPISPTSDIPKIDGCFQDVGCHNMATYDDQKLMAILGHRKSGSPTSRTSEVQKFKSSKTHWSRFWAKVVLNKFNL